MKPKVITGIIPTLLLISMFTLTLNIKEAFPASNIGTPLSSAGNRKRKGEKK